MSRIPITDEIRGELNVLHKKTNVGPQRLLKGKADRPKGLNSTTIYHWMDGTHATAKQSHMEWVLREWRSQTQLEPITQADLELFDKELKRTGFTPTSLLNRLSPVPDGLTPDILHRIRSKRLKKLDKAHKQFLFEGLKNLPEK